MKQSKNSKLIVENGIKGDVLLFPGEVENNGAGIKGINKTLTTQVSFNLPYFYYFIPLVPDKFKLKSLRTEEVEGGNLIRSAFCQFS